MITLVILIVVLLCLFSWGPWPGATVLPPPAGWLLQVLVTLLIVLLILQLVTGLEVLAPLRRLP
jgi:hypothetical protein